MPAKGDGITKRKDGRYMARYTVHTPDGPKRKLIYGKKYRDVERKLAEARGDAARGIVFDDENLTVGKYLDRWLSDSVRGSVRVSTHERYGQIVRLHIKPVIGRVRLKALTPAHVQGLYRNRLDKGLSPATVNKIHAVLHKALKQATRWNMVPRNVAEAVTPPRPASEEIRPLDAEGVAALLEAATGNRLEALYTVAVTTGARENSWRSSGRT
jgi:integrase